MKRAPSKLTTHIVPSLEPFFLTGGSTAAYRETVLRDFRYANALLKRHPDWDETGSLIFPTPAQVETLLKEVEASGEPLVIDLETIGNHPLTAVIRCAGVGYSKRAAVIWFLDEGGVPYWKKPQDEKRVRVALQQRLRNPKLRKLGQNILLYDVPVLENTVNNLGPYFGETEDIMVAHHVLDPELPHGLDYITSIETECPYYKSMVADPDAKGNEKWATIKSAVLGDYNVKDVLSTARSGRRIIPRLTTAWPRAKALYQLEVAVAGELRRMCEVGLRVDRKAQKALSKRLLEVEQKHLALMRKIGKDKEFNPNSLPQLRKMMFMRLGMPILHLKDSRTKKGEASTAKQALFELSLRVDGTKALFLKSLAAHRKAKKLRGTYVDNLPIFPDGRIHPTWRMLTKSGRFAVTPAVNTLPKQIKQIYIADKGCEFAGADLSQAELRVMALFANVKDLQDGYARGADVHALNTVKVFDVRPPPKGYEKTWSVETEEMLNKKVPNWRHKLDVDVSPDSPVKWNTATGAMLVERGVDWRALPVDGAWNKTRDLCKRGVFASNYMAELGTVWRSLRAETDDRTGELVFPDMSKSQVDAFMIAWFQAAPEIPRFAERMLKQAQEQGYYECPISGRRRFFKDKLDLSDAANVPIQTAVASYMNEALLWIGPRVRKYRCEVVLQVHDALALHGPKGQWIKDAAKVMQEGLHRGVMLHGKRFVLPADAIKFGGSLAEI